MCLELQNKKLLFWKKGQGRDALDDFSHLAYASVRELMKTKDLSHEGDTAFMTCRNSGTAEYRNLNCDAPIPGVPLTTRQRGKFMWILGDPIPSCCVPFIRIHIFTKIG